MIKNRMAASKVLKRKELNRALLARQLLMQREKLPVLEVLERLGGLQAQSPTAPYFALWTRLQHFRQEELSDLLLSRKAVRMALMRSTLHLVPASASFEMRQWVQLALERSLQSTYGKQLDGVNPGKLAAAAAELVQEEALTFQEIGKRLGRQWPGHEPAALAAAARTWLPLVQTPPRGIWGRSGQAKHTTAEAWLGLPDTVQADEQAWLRTYLAAFGPATIQDMQMWSGLTRLRETVEGMRDELVVFSDEQGRELFDVPEAPRPEGDQPVPVRFLGEFDNVLLSYADRSRIIDEASLKQVITKNGLVRSTFLIDGFVAGIWKIESNSKQAELRMEPFRKLAKMEEQALEEEGMRMLQFAAEKKQHGISFTSATSSQFRRNVFATRVVR